MQAIAEAYDLLRRALSLPAAETADLFGEWNRGPMESYLIEITSKVLSARDPETGHPLVEMILDQAGQKGTANGPRRSSSISACRSRRSPPPSMPASSPA